MPQKTLSTNQQCRFMTLLADLLSNGFSLQEALSLLQKISLFPESVLEELQHSLETGRTFQEILRCIGLKEEQLLQVELAEIHGDLIATLQGIAQQLTLLEKFRKDLKKLLSYPILLFFFLFGILFSMRQILLPQLVLSDMIDSAHWGFKLIQYVHLYLLGGISLFLFSAGAWRLLARRRDVIARADFYGQLFFIGSIFKLYQSAYLSLEIGKLFQKGLELKQVIFCLKEAKKGSLAQLFAERTAVKLETGEPLAQQFEDCAFLTAEFSRIIQQGEAKGNLGKELLFYSEVARDRFFQKIDRWLQWLQPILFLAVALFILLIYAAILLPLYENMGEVL
ncbi:MULTISPECIES: competence type IV pilus assembly protein ComGB [unclassified Enterococcus]|jgi:competence protein ComGB|uniref:competence type IV pilus assembly protein ComGB n=1 Tax=unclassified Enterococcus TaxID=2608891 RepID=UPI003D28973F